ncbi:DNA helicase [Tanacetum coccineum]
MRIHSSSSSSSLSTSKKLKTILHNFIFSHLCRLALTFTKAKSIVIELLKEKHLNNIKFFKPMILQRNKFKKNKVYFGSFRFHYNWCSSSHVVPVTSRTIKDAFNNHVYYDSTWNSYIDHETVLESQLSGYLQWLEEKNKGDRGVDETNEIDRLADRFIANSHEKFMLEKQESYRRFHEMMARSM